MSAGETAPGEPPSDGTPPRVPPAMRALWRVGMAIGAVLLVAAAVLTINEWRFIASSVRVTGTVSRVDREWMSGSSRYGSGNRGGNWGYRVIASFPADGQVREVRSSSLTSSTGYRPGDPIAVEYPPGRPQQAQLVRFVDRWMLELVLGIIGAAFLAICFFGRWLTTLPGARITSNGYGFAVQTPVYSVDADLRPSRPAGAAAGAPRRVPSLVWIAALLIAGVGIGLLVAHLRGRPEAAAPAPLAATPAADTSNAAPAPGYPSNLTVKAPPMPDDTGATPSWTDPANGGATRANLTAAARAFVARPAVDAAMQAALRGQVAKLGLDCPGIVFGPGETLLLPAPPPLFDAAGTMQRGLVRQRFNAVGCPGRSPAFNVWVFAPGDGAPLRTVAGYPGTTRADLMLMNDAAPIVLAIAGRVARGCSTLAITDTHLTGAARRDAITAWAEDWLVTACGRTIALTVRFIPDPARGMTRIEVPEALARVLAAS